MMKKIRRDFGTTIFLTTHYLEEAEQLSDTICIMKEGKDVIQGTPSTLRRHLKRDILRIRFSDEEGAKKNQQRISSLFKDRITDQREESIHIPINHKQEELSLVGQFLLNQQIPFMGLEIMEPTIEDVFVSLTSHKEESA